MNTAMLDAAMQQMGLAAIHGYAVVAVITAVMLSLSWMAAGLSRPVREF